MKVQIECGVPDSHRASMVCKTQDATCYVMDDCCRDMTGEQLTEREKPLLALYESVLEEAIE